MSVEKDVITDDAIVDNVFASDRDRGADVAAPEPQAKEPVETEPEVKADEAEIKSEDGSSKQYRDPETGRFVPLTELKTERQKRQEEARLRAEAEQRAIAAEARAEEARRYAERFYQQQHQQQQQNYQPPQPPDPFVEPEQYQRYVVGQAQLASLNERLNISQMMAEEKFGAEVVEKALQAAAQAGVAQHFVQARHPYADLVTWFNRQEAIHRIGDPTSFETRIREEERQKVLAELKKGGSASPQKFPGTLADASAAGQQGRLLTDEAIVDSLFASDRRRRA